MKALLFSLAGLILLAGCETKVVNQPSPQGQPLVVEHDHPTVVQQVPAPQPQKPEVQNNIHVDR